MVSALVLLGAVSSTLAAAYQWLANWGFWIRCGMEKAAR